MSSAAATPAWRTFPFFTAQNVHDRHQPGEVPEVFRSSPEISCITAGQGHVLVADINGQLHLCNADFDVVKTWSAHPEGRVTHMKLALGLKGILVTLGEEETSPHPVLKVWNIRHDDRKTGAPRLLAAGKIQYGSRPHPVSTLAMTATLSLVAVGLADGTVLLLRQLDQYLQSASTSASAGPAGIPKPKLVHSSPSDPVTGLGFRSSSSTGETGFTNTITGNTVPKPAENRIPAPNAGPTNVTLFIITTHQILTYKTTATGRALPGSSAHATVMDDVGAGLGCSALLPSGEMVLAKDEAIYVYGLEGRGQSYFYEGAKTAIASYSNYLIITSPPFVPTASSQSATVRNFMREQRTNGNGQNGTIDTGAKDGPAFDLSTDISKVTIFDPENKFVAYSGAFPEGVREVFCEWGEIFVLTNDSKISRLVERSTQDKLGMLFTKNLYVLAINLARTSGLDEGEVADICKRYGDYLYEKADYDGAMQQFIKTIGKVQPSYVIRKFLDGQRINNLTSYLQELHSQNLANSDITTLLLNCYAKLKDTDRLDSFIKTSSAPSPDASGTTPELPFDLETAIRVCRQAGYLDHAVYLAERYEQHEEYLRIQIEDREEWADAVRYIRRLETAIAEENLRKYGKTLLTNYPKETTELLVDLCCGTLDRPLLEEQEQATVNGRLQQQRQQSRGSYLSYLALNKSSANTPAATPGLLAGGAAPSAPGGEAARAPRSRQATSNTITHYTVAPSLTVTEADTRPSSPTNLSQLNEVAPPPEEALPEIRQFFAHYIDQPRYFITFLETVAERRWGQTLKGDSSSLEAPGPATPAKPLLAEDEEADKKEQEAIWNTLIELYLSEANAERKETPSKSEESEFESKALRLLQRKSSVELPYDATQALLVCTTSNFVPGLLAIYEQLGMYEDILRYWMNSPAPSSSTKVISTLQKFGPNGNPHLYPIVLKYLTSDNALLSKHKEELLQVLHYIDEEKIMPPIQVVQALSKSGVATVGLVKDYLRRQIINEQEEVEADRSLAKSYKQDLMRKEQEIQELSDPATPRIFQVTRCSACGGSLDLPSVHFMCRHSYHQRCLADNEASCPNCASAHGVVMEIKAENERIRERSDLFKQELDDSDDRYETIVSAFGRGLVRPSEE